MEQKKNIYFVSDLHLGIFSFEKSLRREKLFVQWLDEIKSDAKEIYLLGDVFDFWFEYKKVVPRGFTRFLGKIAEITDSGIPVHYFTGNHDIWVFDYLPKETGIILHREALLTNISGQTFFLAHGDGLDPDDKGFIMLKKFFNNSFAQWLFKLLHPNFAVKIGHYWSKKSRFAKGKPEEFRGEDKESLILFAKNKLKEEKINFFIIGHRHIPLDLKLENKSRIIILGDWIFNFSYAKFDGKDVQLKTYSPNESDSSLFLY